MSGTEPIDLSSYPAPPAPDFSLPMQPTHRATCMAALMEELVEEILLRVPPAHLWARDIVPHMAYLRIRRWQRIRRWWWHDSLRRGSKLNTVLLCLNNDIELGVFTLNLKSRQMRKVAQTWDEDVLPYTSFYDPGTCSFLNFVTLHACLPSYFVS